MAFARNLSFPSSYPSDNDDEAAHEEAGLVVDRAILVKDGQRVGPWVARGNSEHLPQPSFAQAFTKDLRREIDDEVRARADACFLREGR